MSIHEFEPKAPRARSDLVRYLRHLADCIEAEEAETDPRAALIVLTGPLQHEVLHVGHDAEPGFLRGALHAAQAVYRPHYATLGGNIRPRRGDYAGGPARGDVVALRRSGGEAS